MKNKLILFLSLITVSIISAQTIYIPDSIFKNRLLTNSTGNFGTGWYNNEPTSYVNIDTNNDGEIQQSEVANITYLNLPTANISNITGIEYFVSLKRLELWSNPISSINLQTLTQLEILNLGNCQLTSLALTGLTNLKSFACHLNQISNLNFSGLLNLIEISCYSNLLTTLDFMSNPLLTRVGCFNNPNLTTLKIKNGVVQEFSNAYGYCLFRGNPNLNYICADAAEIPVLQAFHAANCIDNNASCVIDSACVLGVEDFVKENDILLYPNPSTNILNIENLSTETISNIEIYSVNGSLISQIKPSQNIESINVSNYQKGVYFVKIIVSTQVKNYKFVKN